MKTKKRILDEKTKFQLAGLLPCGNDFTISYIPDIYKEVDEDFQPTFTIKPYSSKELKDVISMSNKMTGDALDNYAHNMVRSHIVGWSNLVNISTNEDIEFKPDEDGGASKEIYESLPISLKTDIMSELTRISSGISVKQ